MSPGRGARRVAERIGGLLARLGGADGPAVVTMANDAFLDWFLGFLESFRHHNPHRPLWVIPFAEDTRIVTALADVYRFHLVPDADGEVIRAIAGALYDDHYWKNRVRKLNCFDLPLTEFLYIDADCIVTGDLAPLFGHLRRDRRLLYGMSQAAGVYAEGAAAGGPGTAQFSSGVFACSRRHLPLSRLAAFVAARADEIRAILPPSDVDQPLLNYFAETTRLPVASLNAVQKAVHAVAWAGNAPRFDVRDGQVVNRQNGRPVAIVHFSGISRELAAGSPLDALRLRYLAAAERRCRAAGLDGMPERR